MLVRIRDDRYLNTDFVVLLSLMPPGIADVKGKELPSVTTWKIVARMLDGSHQLLIELETEEMARIEYDRLIRDANKRLKRLEYEDD